MVNFFFFWVIQVLHGIVIVVLSQENPQKNLGNLGCRPQEGERKGKSGVTVELEIWRTYEPKRKN